MAKVTYSKNVAVLAGVAAFLLTSSAFAGFEWKGQVAPPAAPPAASAAAPTVLWSDGGAPVMPAAPVQKVEEFTATDPSLPPPILSSDLYVPPPSAPAPAEEVISGFGADLPLAIALQQVVPAGYQFSFGPHIGPGTPVSWEGGKPWREVLANMLTESGLGYQEENNVITVVAAPLIATAPVVAETQHVVVTESSAASAPISIRRDKPSYFQRKWREWNHSKEDTSVEETTEVTIQSAPQEASVTPGAGVPSTSPVMTAPVPLSAPVAEPPAASQPALVAPLPPPVTVSAAPAGAEPVVSEPVWHGAKGQTLREVLKNWSDVADVELYWSIDYDYRLTEDVGYPGTYDEALGSLLDRFAGIRPQPYGQLHQDGSNPRVLVVKSYDLTP